MMRALAMILALCAALPAWAQAPGEQAPPPGDGTVTDQPPVAAADPAPVPPPPPTQACIPPDARPGQWWHDYTMATVDGQDRYVGQAIDCTNFALAVPAGTPACRAMGTRCQEIVLSVLPVAWRRAMRATLAPTGTGDLLTWLLAQPLSADQRDAIEYMVRAERGDLVAGGLPAALVDQVMTLAATYPGADPVRGPAP